MWRLKSLWNLTIPWRVCVVIWGKCTEIVYEGSGVGDELISEVWFWNWFEGEEDIDLDDDFGV